MITETLYFENRWRILFGFDEEGNIKKRYWIVKPRIEKKYYQKYGYKAVHPEDRGWHLRLFDKNLQKTEISKRYYNTHKKECAERQRVDRIKHPETMKKHAHKRRGLGFQEINDYIENSQAHHINKEYVVHIPKEVHIHFSHNIWSGLNMDKINMSVCGFFIWILSLSGSDDYITPLGERKV